MAFTSFIFLVFLLFSLSIFTIIVSFFPQGKAFFIVLLNIFFYAFFGLNGLAIFTVLIILAYLSTLMIQLSAKKKVQQKLWLIATISLPLGALLFFKFFQPILQLATTNGWIPFETTLQFLLPVGLSFYSFRIVSHAVDVFRGNVKLPGLIKYAAFIGFFPHIIAGPLSEAHKFYEDLNSTRYEPKLNQITLLFLSGFFKKLVISSFLYTYTTQVFQLPQQFAAADIVFALAIFSAYIFTDFSGYSDLANGTAMLFGFRPVENFAGPYGSKSVGEFWSRWHISLSSWFRNYIYIPAGGDGRNSKWKKLVWIRNIIGVMVISGVWHGVGFGFVLWGFAHGIAIIFGTILKNLIGGVTKKLTIVKLITNWIAMFFTFILLVQPGYFLP